MKGKNYIRYFYCFWFFVFFAGSSAAEHSENPFELKTFFVESALKYPWNYTLTAGINTAAVETLARVKMDGKRSGIPLQPYSLGIRFTPLFYTVKKKLIPALSFYYGGINKAGFMTAFSARTLPLQRPSSAGMQFFPKNTLKLSAVNRDISYGAELSLNNFNVTVLAEQEYTVKWPDLHFSALYKTKDLKNGDISTGLVLYSSLYLDPYSQFAVKNPRYNGLFGSRFLFSALTDHGSYKLLFSGSANMPYEKLKPSFAGTAEFGFLGGYAGFNTGFRARERDFSAAYGKAYTETAVFFFQPKLIFGSFKIDGVYDLVRFYEKKVKKQYEKKYRHAGGIDFGFSNSLIVCKTGFFYEKEKWQAEAVFKLKKAAFWHEVFSVSTKFVLEDKTVNPFVVRLYSADALLKINCGGGVKLGVSGDFSQKNAVVKKRKKPPVTQWKEPEFEAGLLLEYGKKLKYIKHSLKTEFTVKGPKPHFLFSILYKISK